MPVYHRVRVRGLGLGLGAYTVVRSTSQSYGDSKISGGQNSQTPEPIYKNIGDYIGDVSPHAKTQSDCLIGGVAAYA